MKNIKSYQGYVVLGVTQCTVSVLVALLLWPYFSAEGIVQGSGPSETGEYLFYPVPIDTLILSDQIKEAYNYVDLVSNNQMSFDQVVGQQNRKLILFVDANCSSCVERMDGWEYEIDNAGIQNRSYLISSHSPKYLKTFVEKLLPATDITQIHYSHREGLLDMLKTRATTLTVFIGPDTLIVYGSNTTALHVPHIAEKYQLTSN